MKALAEEVTANAPTEYDKVAALESWIGAHTRYTTNIPPLRRGQDTVTEFLFGNRRGYCEQISTSLAVMLRSLGIPAREVTGYVPGSFNPITDLYEVRAKDAHAWVDVWFPRYGWQSFDPTARVALANPTPARALAHATAGALHRLAVVPVGLAAAGVVLAVLVWRRRRRAPVTWSAAVARDLEAAARRAGLQVGPEQTLVGLSAMLDLHWPRRRPPPSPGPRILALAAERAAYGHDEPDRATQRALRRAARRVRRAARRVQIGTASVTPQARSGTPVPSAGSNSSVASTGSTGPVRPDGSAGPVASNERGGDAAGGPPEAGLRAGSRRVAPAHARRPSKGRRARRARGQARASANDSSQPAPASSSGR